MKEFAKLRIAWAVLRTSRVGGAKHIYKILGKGKRITSQAYCICMYYLGTYSVELLSRTAGGGTSHINRILFESTVTRTLE
jgi:hypothetical protein